MTYQNYVKAAYYFLIHFEKNMSRKVERIFNGLKYSKFNKIFEWFKLLVLLLVFLLNDGRKIALNIMFFDLRICLIFLHNSWISMKNEN